MVYDVQNQDDTKFTKEVAGFLGAFATANQWCRNFGRTTATEVPFSRENPKENTHNWEKYLEKNESRLQVDQRKW